MIFVQKSIVFFLFFSTLRLMNERRRGYKKMIQKIFLFVISFLIFILSLPFILAFVFVSWLRGRRVRRVWKEWEKQTRRRSRKSLDENVIDVEYEEVA